MKTSEEMTKSLLKRRNEYFSAQKRRRTAAVKIARAGSVTCCVAAAAVVGVNVLNRKNSVTNDITPVVSTPDTNQNSNSAISSSDSVNNSQTPNVQSTPTTSETPEIPENVIWSQSSTGGVSISESVCMTLWHGKPVSYELKNAFDKYDDGSIFAVSLLTGYSADYVYNGRTISEMLDEQTELGNKIEKLREFVKTYDYVMEQEEVQHLTSGDETEILNTYVNNGKTVMETLKSLGDYITDGKFDREKLEADVEAGEKALESLRDEIIIAKELSLKAAFENTISELKAKNIPFELRELKGDIPTNYSRNIIIIYISENDLADLELSEQDSILFGFASKNANGEDIVYDMIVEC